MKLTYRQVENLFTSFSNYEKVAPSLFCNSLKKILNGDVRSCIIKSRYWNTFTRIPFMIRCDIRRMNTKFASSIYSYLSVCNMKHILRTRLRCHIDKEQKLKSKAVTRTGSLQQNKQTTSLFCQLTQNSITSDSFASRDIEYLTQPAVSVNNKTSIKFKVSKY